MRPEEMIGQKLGHYRIIRPLGHGGSAMVFLAEDIHLQRDIAIKVFRPPTDNTQDFLRRFAREARVLAQLDHPNILPVYEYGEEDATAYLVMPHMAGGSLRDWLRGRGAIPANETVRLMSQILRALQYAHDRNLIHRDIKPGNMLFKADGTLMLSDFGLVKVLANNAGQLAPLDETPTNTTAQMLTGTPDYMAPEQINHKVVPASDIYAMGVVLYEMLTGTRMFNVDSYISVLIKHLHERPRSLREINPQISPELDNIVQRALDKEPTQRYQRPIDLLQALQHAIGKDTTIIHGEIDTNIINNSVPSSQLPSTENKENTTLAPSRYPHINPPVPSIASSTSSTATQPEMNILHLSAPLSVQQATPNQLSPGMPQTPKPAQRPRSNKPLIVALVLIILVLATSLGRVLYSQDIFKTHVTPLPTIGTAIPPTRPPTTIANKGGPTPNIGNNGNTEMVPQTQTDCPTSDQARAAVTARLVLGNKQNIIYIVNEGTATNPTFGTIERREADQNSIGVEISKMPHTSIGEAQVSRDGQWVLFVANTDGRSQLRMVRVDGQGLQTLYCTPTNITISHTQWSFDQRTVVFNAGPDKSIQATYLLDVILGSIRTELIPQNTYAYAPRTWLDNTHIYMTGSVPNASTNTPQDLYLLDITKGANQQDGDLQKIIPGPQACGSFDSSYDSQQLLISACQQAPQAGSNQNSPIGPSTITSEPATGGTAQKIITLPTAITMLRAVSPTTLLLLLENSTSDITRNGLWKINSDGSGLTQLSNDTTNGQSLCPFSQYAWSNISRDGSMYALQEFDTTKDTYNMYFGSLNGGQPYQFANIVGTQLSLVGWTSL